jgi:RCC1 and BTB domain-containing protein
MQIPFFRHRGIKSASLGFVHSAAVSNQGQLYTWGGGMLGQLGHGNLRDEWEPRLVEGVSEVFVTQVSCMGEYTVF